MVRYAVSVINTCLSPLTRFIAAGTISDLNVGSVIWSYLRYVKNCAKNTGILQKIMYVRSVLAMKNRSKEKVTQRTDHGCLTIATKHKVFEAGSATNVTGRWVVSMTTSKPYKER